MKLRQDTLFACVITGIVALLLFKAFEYGPQTRLALVATGTPLLILLLIYIIQGFFPKLSTQFNKIFSGVTQSREKQIPNEVKPIQKKELISLLWLLILVAMIIILGLIVSLPIFVLLYMKIYGSEKWKLSLTISGIVLLFIYLVFGMLLDMPFYEGFFYNILS